MKPWERITYGINLNEKVKHRKQNCKFKCLVKTADLNISLGLTSFFLSLSSVQFSHSVVSDALRPHGLQHSRPPCPSPTPGVYSNPCPLSQRCLCHPLLLPPSIFPSIRLFSNESALRIRWPKYWSFSFKISPSNEHPGLSSFRIDWLGLLAVQGTLKSLFQHHSSKAHQFFGTQLSL